MADFGARLKAIREERKITQHDLAHKLRERGFGTTQTTVSRWEAGQEPRMYVLRALAEELGTSVEDLSSDGDDAEAAQPMLTPLSRDECAMLGDLMARLGASLVPA